MHREGGGGVNAQELNESVTAPVFFYDSAFRGLGWSRFFPEQRRRAVNHYLFLCFTLSSGGERNERGSDGTEKGGEKGRERAGESRREEDASASAARSSNYYGFSGSNSPDGNTTQFTHADCAREDVNSCQSDGPFHLLFFAGAPNRHRGRSWTIIRFSTFSSPVLRPLSLSLPSLLPPFHARFAPSCLHPDASWLLTMILHISRVSSENETKVEFEFCDYRLSLLILAFKSQARKIWISC